MGVYLPIKANHSLFLTGAEPPPSSWHMIMGHNGIIFWLVSTRDSGWPGGPEILMVFGGILVYIPAGPVSKSKNIAIPYILGYTDPLMK